MKPVKVVFWNFGQVYMRENESFKDAGSGHIRENWKRWCARHGWTFRDVSGLWPMPVMARNPELRGSGAAHGIANAPESVR